jgi:transposase
MVRLCDQILLDFFVRRKRGRKPKNIPITVVDAHSNTKDLETENETYAFQNTPNLKFKWHIKNIPNADLKILEQWKKSNDKRIWDKAVTILDSQRLSLEELSFKIEQPIKKIKNWIKAYHQHGIYGLEDKRGKRNVGKSDEIVKTRTKRIMEIIHQNPKTYGINRSNWTQFSISIAYERKYCEKISKSSIGILLKNSGYSLKRARNVLKSPDPNYREKVELVLKTLWSLQANDMFFFIDELGPLRVKKYGGKCYTKRGETVNIPQNFSSKGSITLYGALSATTNQVTWNFGKSKDTSAMIDLIEILFNQYYNKSKIYITWDAASWHRSNQLVEWLDLFNAQTKKIGTGPIIELVPLPSCSQFLDVIEAVFSAMKKAVIHHSNYQSEGEMKSAISLHFVERNDYFNKNPKRAGKKIWEIDFFKDYNNIKSGNYRAY